MGALTGTGAGAAGYIDRPSPNHEPRRAGRAIDMLVLHYTGMDSAAAALDRLCDPAARVSAHYLIDEDGAVFRLVPEQRRAWHAGVAYWAGETDINSCSLGIELVNPGHELGYRPFPERQMRALAALAAAAVARYRIPARRVVGHSDVAPARKKDPGELFDWPRLARAGVGLWPPGPRPARVDAPTLRRNDRGPAVAAAQSALSAYGYGAPIAGTFDAATEEVVAAFQRHFRPHAVTGAYDAESEAILNALLDMSAEDDPRTP